MCTTAADWLVFVGLVSTVLLLFRFWEKRVPEHVLPGDPKYHDVSRVIGELIRTGIIGTSILLPLSIGQLPLVKSYSLCQLAFWRWAITILFFSLGFGTFNAAVLPTTLLVADITKDRLTHFLLAFQYASILLAVALLAAGFLVAYPL